MQREPEEPLRKDPAGRSKVDVQESWQTEGEKLQEKEPETDTENHLETTIEAQTETVPQTKP